MENDKVLLDYYTKSMTTHATLTVAAVFGLFSVLNIVVRVEHLLPKMALSICYLLLALFGSYEITRYRHYADVAKQKAKLFEADEGEKRRSVKLARKMVFPHAFIIYWVFMLAALAFVWLDFLLNASN